MQRTVAYSFMPVIDLTPIQIELSERYESRDNVPPTEIANESLAYAAAVHCQPILWVSLRSEWKEIKSVSAAIDVDCRCVGCEGIVHLSPFTFIFN